jgi:tRNA pseudouridine13 synthase
MKLKQRPDDFQVEELTDRTPGEHGPYAFYRLDKEGWGTPEAVQAVRRRWHLDAGRLSYGGLKDRHARTVQYLSIRNGPRRGLTHHSVRLTYLGQVTSPYTSHDIRANRFQATLRALGAEERAFAEATLPQVSRDGVPNYFDDQRFGSVGEGGEFAARAMVLGNYEEALKLALAAPYEYDRAEQKREKAILRANWGNWPACKEKLPRGHARSLVDYLVHHPTDFRGAVARLRPDLGGLYLSAYQSYLWNRMLAGWLRRHLRPEQLLSVRFRLSPLPMYRDLDDEQRQEMAGLQFPLPSARLKLDEEDPRRPLIEAALAGEGFKLEEMKLKGLREPFFSKGERAALCLPTGLMHEVGSDELNAGKDKLVLRFELPRGSYATALVKRLTAARPAQTD